MASREELAELVNRRPLTTLLVTYKPRAPHMAAELAALRDEIARRLNEALL